MIRTSLTDSDTNEVLAAYDAGDDDDKRSIAAKFAAVAIAFTHLLEQHSSYDLGDGWVVRIHDGKWNIFYKNKHESAWTFSMIEPQRGWTSYGTVTEAIEVAQQLAATVDWVESK